jgi:TIR domain
MPGRWNVLTSSPAASDESCWAATVAFLGRVQRRVAQQQDDVWPFGDAVACCHRSRTLRRLVCPPQEFNVEQPKWLKPGLMLDREPYDVFLSHSASASEAARALAARLREARLRVFFDEDTLRVGDNWYSAIDDALRSAAVAVVLIGPGTSSLDRVPGEVVTAAAGAMTGQSLLVPVLVGDVDVAQVPRGNCGGSAPCERTRLRALSERPMRSSKQCSRPGAARHATLSCPDSRHNVGRKPCNLQVL